MIVSFSAAVISVTPTDHYYEKVSEELEKIIHEVQEKEEVVPLSDGEKQLPFMFSAWQY